MDKKKLLSICKLTVLLLIAGENRMQEYMEKLIGTARKKGNFLPLQKNRIIIDMCLEHTLRTLN